MDKNGDIAVTSQVLRIKEFTHQNSGVRINILMRNSIQGNSQLEPLFNLLIGFNMSEARAVYARRF